MNKPNDFQKFLALCNLLPKMADYIDDIKDRNMFKHDLMKTANNLIKKIRATDNRFFWKQGFEEDITEEEFNKRILAIMDTQWIHGNSFDEFVYREFEDFKNKAK